MSESPEIKSSPEIKPPRRSRMKVYVALLVVLLLLVAWIDLPYYVEVLTFRQFEQLGGRVIVQTDDSWLARWNDRIHVNVVVVHADTAVRDGDLAKLQRIADLGSLDQAR